MAYESKCQLNKKLVNKDYLFRLKGNTRLFFKNSVEVDFTPVRALELGHKQQSLDHFSITPKFNFDQKFYSQAFSS